MSSRLGNFLLCMVSIALALAAGEIFAERLYEKPWFDHLLEERSSPSENPKHALNSFGLRGREHPKSKPSNCRRVLILGDSFTYGSGVSDDAEIFPAILERELNAEFKASGETVEILNGGIPASLTGQWVELQRKVGRDFKPDLVLAVFFLRDGTRTTALKSFFDPIREELRSRKRSWLYRHSAIVRTVADAFDRARIGRVYSKAIVDSYFGDSGQTEEWKTAQANLLRIRSTARQSGGEMALAVFPILADLNAGYPFKNVCDEIERFSVQNGVPTLSLLQAFMGRKDHELWVSPADQHPNRLGHRIAAEALKPFIRNILLKNQNS